MLRMMPLDDDPNQYARIALAGRALGCAVHRVWTDNPAARPWLAAAGLLLAAVLAKEIDDLSA